MVLRHHPLRDHVRLDLPARCIKHDEEHKAEYDHGDARHQITLRRRPLARSSSSSSTATSGSTRPSTSTTSFWNFDKAEQQPDAVRIEINAHQWAWDARYAGPDGKFNTEDDIVTLNDIRVPVDTPVILELASADVIHSFYLPNLRIKQDAMPGMINRMWFQAKETGRVRHRLRPALRHQPLQDEGHPHRPARTRTTTTWAAEAVGERRARLRRERRRTPTGAGTGRLN